MKKLLVVAAIAVAGCAARAPEQKPATPAQRAGTPGTVEVATFTAEVDPVARTFQIISQPTAAGRALGMSRMVEVGPTTVSIANSVVNGTTQVYINRPQRSPDRLCTNGYLGRVWGANVTLTTLAANTTLSNLYVQITAFSGPPGSGACNSAKAPAGITDLGLGLWSSPVTVAGEVTQDWTFQYVTAARFTFAGRILASVAELFPNGVYPAGTYGIVDNGTGVVYSDLDDTRLVFLEPGTGTTWNATLSTAIPDYAWALSKDVNKSSIWYATGGTIPDAAYVGYVSSGDRGATGGSRNVQGLTAAPISVKPWAIAADPDGLLAESRAWFVASNFDNTTTVSAYVGASRLGTVDREPGGAVSLPTWVANLDGTLARSLVFADADNIYVTLAPTGARPNGAIQRCTKSAGCGVTPDIIVLPAECQSPDVIVVSPTTGNLWFTAGFDSPGGGVCTFDPLFALPDRVADAPYASYLAVGPNGEVWVGEYAEDRMQRIVQGDPPFYVSTNVGPGYGTVWALGKLWVVTLDGVNRITP